MTRKNWRGCFFGIAMLCMVAGMAYAGDGSSTAQGESGDKVARLETLLNAQQLKIDSLEQQLVAASAQDQDAARVEAMKQQIREVLSEQEFRESLMPSMVQAGYDNGFFIKSSDDKFKMKVNGRLQFRWTHYEAQKRNHFNNTKLHRNDRTGFDLQRLFINFTGHAYTPDLTYVFHIYTSGAQGYGFTPFYAYVNYRFSDELQFRAGRMRILTTRAQFYSDAVGQFPDRPMVDAVFGSGLGIGAQFWGKLFDKQFEYYFQVLNEIGGADAVITPDVAGAPTGASMDSNPALVFRAVWHAMGGGMGNEGEVPDGSAFKCFGDIDCCDCPALDFGFHYMFNEDEGDGNMRLPYPLPRRLLGQGGFGLTDSMGCQINQFGFDAAFKYMGFSATGEYTLRMVDPRRAGRRPYSSWWLATNQGDTTVQQGAYLQLGYFLPIPGLENKLEAAVRVGAVSALANGRECAWEYSGGLNYYIEGNKVKLQADITKITEAPITSNFSSMANVNDDPLIFRVQLQVAF